MVKNIAGGILAWVFEGGSVYQGIKKRAGFMHMGPNEIIFLRDMNPSWLPSLKEFFE